MTPTNHSRVWRWLGALAPLVLVIIFAVKIAVFGNAPLARVALFEYTLDPYSGRVVAAAITILVLFVTATVVVSASIAAWRELTRQDE